jgi:hypothetical protein
MDDRAARVRADGALKGDMMDIGLSNLYRMRDCQSRSINAENPRGEKGGGARATFQTTLHEPSARAARELGPGWKLSPCIGIKAGETATLAEIEGAGVIRHIWATLEPKFHRDVILRMYWDDDPTPSVECPIGDFFCSSWKYPVNILSEPINVNPVGGLNCYFPMPFARRARITAQNDSPNDLRSFYYTVNYTLEACPPDALRFHAQWRRSNPVPYGELYTMIDGVRGRGQYVGTFMSWQQNNAIWWGEGEIQMFLDGDDSYPTICGTGTEDYFGGAWGFERKGYSESFTAPYLGYQDIQPETSPTFTGLNIRAGSRFTLYRFHVHDPVFFHTDLRVQMQCIGWRSEGRYLPLQDDVASVVYWYQTLPHAALTALPDRNYREII